MAENRLFFHTYIIYIYIPDTDVIRPKAAMEHSPSTRCK